MKRQLIPLTLIALLAGCASGIPLFDAKARTLNRVASAEELLIETNLVVAQARTDGLLTQAEIDKAITPSLNRAKGIILTTRAVARGTSTTQPTGTLDDARAILISVRSILLQIQGAK